MARRPLTNEQELALADIRRLLMAERTAEAVAYDQAMRVVREQTAQARAQTNAAIHRARETLGITVTAITERGLGNTNRAAVLARMAEHEGRHGSLRTRNNDGVVTTVDVETDLGVFVHQEDDGVRVTMREFTHPDVGDDVTGWVLYDAGGDMIEHDDKIASLVANPLVPMRLWGLPEVQSQLP